MTTIDAIGFTVALGGLVYLAIHFLRLRAADRRFREFQDRVHAQRTKAADDRQTDSQDHGDGRMFWS